VHIIDDYLESKGIHAGAVEETSLANIALYYNNGSFYLV